MTTKKQKQEYYYRGVVYRYVIREDSLLKLKRTEQIMDLKTWLYQLPQNAIIALYYCTYWEGLIISVEEFLQDYKDGHIRFSGMKGQFSLIGVRGLIREGLRRYRLM